MMISRGVYYVRREKKKQIVQSEKMSHFLPSVAVEEYPLGIILPVRCNDDVASTTNNDVGGVLTRDGEYVVASVTPGWVAGMYTEYQCQYSSKIAVYCGRMIGQWGHFLLESITRLWFFLQHDNPAFIYVFIVREGTDPPLIGNFKLFFDLLGIENERIVLLNQPTQYQKVIVPQRSFQYRRFYSQEYISVLDSVIRGALSLHSLLPKNQKIFLSRSRFERAKKSEIGLTMLDEYYRSNGYEIIHPESISLIDLITRLQFATHCVSESGSVAHNFLFCRERQSTVVMERQTIVNDAQTSIDCVRNLNTTYVDSHLTLLPIYTGAGPFFLYYTSCFEKFTYDNGYLKPSSTYMSRPYIEKCLTEYDEMCKTIYNNNSPKVGNEARFSFLLDEAYLDTCLTLKRYGVKITRHINYLTHTECNRLT